MFLPYIWAFPFLGYGVFFSEINSISASAGEGLDGPGSSISVKRLKPRSNAALRFESLRNLSSQETRF
jgi:hypothetical protein